MSDSPSLADQGVRILLTRSGATPVIQEDNGGTHRNAVRLSARHRQIVPKALRCHLPGAALELREGKRVLGEQVKN